jgi:hypothetical protein
MKRQRHKETDDEPWRKCTRIPEGQVVRLPVHVDLVVGTISGFLPAKDRAQFSRTCRDVNKLKDDRVTPSK